MFFFNLITGHGRTRFSTSTSESASAGTSKPNRLVAWLRDVRAALATPFRNAKEAFQKSSGKMGAEIVSVHGGDTEQTGPTSQSRRRWSIPHDGDTVLNQQSWTLPARFIEPKARQVPNLGTEQPALPNGVTPRRVETKPAPSTTATQTESPVQCTSETQTEPPVQCTSETQTEPPVLCTSETQAEQSGQSEPDAVVTSPQVNATPAQVVKCPPPAPGLSPKFFESVVPDQAKTETNRKAATKTEPKSALSAETAKPGEIPVKEGGEGVIHRALMGVSEAVSSKAGDMLAELKALFASKEEKAAAEKAAAEKAATGQAPAR